MTLVALNIFLGNINIFNHLQGGTGIWNPSYWKTRINILHSQYHGGWYRNKSRSHDHQWRHQMETFSALLVLGAVNSPHKGQWRGALMFSLIYAGTSGWVNDRDAGDLRRHRARYDVNILHGMNRYGIGEVWRENSGFNTRKVNEICRANMKHIQK